MFTSTRERVTNHTDPAINEQIRLRMEMKLAYFQGHPERIDSRLEELDKEWDVERMLETGSSTLTLTGLLLGLAPQPKVVVAIADSSVLFRPARRARGGARRPVLRRLGFRTEHEIEQERYALKAMRGDFQKLPESSETRGASPILEAVRR